MFVPAEFQSMRRLCPSELEKLLDELSIRFDWSGDEYRTYEKLDALITKKICERMKSESIFDGYTKLLKLGGVDYNFSELDSELLDKIVSNGDKILAAVHKANDKYKAWQAQWGNVSSAPERVDTFKIKIYKARPFRNPKSTSRLQEAWNYIKNYLSTEKKQSDYRVAVAYEDINSYVNDKRTPGTLLELDGQIISINVEDVGEWIKRNMSNSDTKIFCLEVTKDIEYRKKEIPTEPTEPTFTDIEVEAALKILRKVDYITKKIAR